MSSWWGSSLDEAFGPTMGGGGGGSGGTAHGNNNKPLCAILSDGGLSCKAPSSSSAMSNKSAGVTSAPPPSTRTASTFSASVPRGRDWYEHTWTDESFINSLPAGRSLVPVTAPPPPPQYGDSKRY